MNLQKYNLIHLNYVYMRLVPPQLSFGNTCQTYTWYWIGNQCVDGLKNGENNPRPLPPCGLLSDSLYSRNDDILHKSGKEGT